MMRTFHVHIHASPTHASSTVASQAAVARLPTQAYRLDDVDLPVLVGFLANEPFSSTFEDTADRLQSLPGLFFEPDGSFAWNRGRELGHVEGMLFDRNDRVQYCEVKGTCPLGTFEQLLEQLKGATSDTVIQLAHEGVFVEEKTFLGLWAK
jgi:hypothetical protein